MLDGPQGLARVGCRIRTSERSLAAAGKTGDRRPPLSQPYGGFVASSLDLFAAFHAAGLFDPSSQHHQLQEVYPAAIWTRLARGLPNKRRRDGRQARVAILRTLGVAVPDAPNHDELDACAAALLAAAADGHIQGLRVAAVGDPVCWDNDAACLREGQILIPEVDAAVFTKLQSVVAPWIAAPEKRTLRAVRSASTALRGAGELSVVARPSLDGATREDRAVSSSSCWRRSSSRGAQHSARIRPQWMSFSDTRSTRRLTDRCCSSWRQGQGRSRSIHSGRSRSTPSL